MPPSPGFPAPVTAGHSAAATGKLVRLSLAKVDEQANAVAGSTPFEVMLNPQKIQHAQSISYVSGMAGGGTGSPNKFDAMLPGTASCELMLDGTGVVPVAAGQRRLGVDKQIDQLRDVVYRYDGNKHEPGHVKLIWGSLILFVRLTSLTLNYVMFRPDGVPLRATADLRFVEFQNFREAQARERRSSPDLTHSVLVREGDTLPLRCQRFYGDPAYYVDVARHNGLASIRRLRPGMRLSLPPLS